MFSFQRWEDYLLDSRFLYSKLHGSVNWVYRIPNVVKTAGVDETSLALGIAQRLDLDSLARYEIEIARRMRRIHNDSLLYPAMTLPVEGKYQFACPDWHVEKVREELPSCTHALVIGMSGLDQDVTDLLAASMTACERIFVVGGSDHAEVGRRFRGAVPSAGWVSSDEGFSRFLQNKALDSFLEDLV